MGRIFGLWLIVLTSNSALENQKKRKKERREGEEKLVNSMRKGKILLYTNRFSTFQPFLYLSRVILLF